MLHDRILSKTTDPLTQGERRQSDRHATKWELTLLWHHDPGNTMRFTVVDRSDGGFRLRTTTPLLTGQTGMALTLLPEGRRLDKPVMVAWSQFDPECGAYDVGLRVI